MKKQKMNQIEKEMELKRVNRALDMFDDGYSCSQAVFCPYADPAQISPQSALKLSDAMGGGMGGMAETCGAVTGAYLALGLKYGRTNPQDDAAKLKTRTLIQEFTRKFKDLHGTLICKELLDCDISTPEGKQKAEETGITNFRCPTFVENAAKLLEQLLKN